MPGTRTVEKLFPSYLKKGGSLY